MKRILSLDGGGIRGVFSLQILKRIEELFREERKNPRLVLADVFDFFAGTSTGAIIATFLSWGKSVGEIERLYVDRAAEMFARAPIYDRWKTKFQEEKIAGFFQEFFCEDDKTPARLGTKKLRTLLLVVVRNATTGSPWPLSNNPKAKYNSDPSRPDCNLNVPLWQLLRASTAAPSFFPPQEIELGGVSQLFVDGGVTPYNNPALIAVLMATLPAYRLCWPATREELHVISIGTGTVLASLPKKVAKKIHLVDHLGFVIPAVIGSVGWEQDLICRVLGDCVFGARLDGELGTLNPEMDALDAELKKINASLPPDPYDRKFTYVRYDELNKAPEKPARLDDLSLIDNLREEGKNYAAQNVRREHLYPRDPQPAA